MGPGFNRSSRGYCVSAPSSPRPSKVSKSTAMGDVDMPQAPDVYLDSPKSYNPPARGWTKALIRANHIDEVVELLDKNPIAILDSDFFDRGSGPAAIKATFVSNKIPDADKIDIYPPTPKEDVADGRHLSMPWTNIAINCTAAFTSAVLASPVFHNIHDDLPISFYCLPVDPDMPWIFAVYTGLTGLAEPAEFKQAALTKLLTDDVVLQMARDDHSNVPGDHSPAFIIRVALDLAQISKCTVVRRGGYNRRSIPTIAHRILIPPISKNWDATQRLQDHLMSAGFTIDVHMRGKATPWMGSDPQHPTLMSCNECHGIDHYYSDCPILNSPGYRTAHGIPEDEDDAGNSSIPTSLTAAPMAPRTNDWSSVPYRGAGRGQFRGGQGGGRFRGGGGGRARSGYGGGFGRGGYGRGGYGRGFSPYL
ncbi:hypothetical protein B0H11DRAFT_1922114 [Mycena galericulata]|nr:hypothetical protein B0H11DRAFT_1922114 [Mycena galericulata]